MWEVRPTWENLVPDRFLNLMTEAEAADFLGVPVEAVALWAREGRLLVAARSEGGQLLFYRWRVEQDGAALAAFAPIRWLSGRRRGQQTAPPSDYGALACGCRLSPSPGRLCRTGAALLAAASLSEDIAATVSDDAFLRKLAGLCRDALARHVAGPLAERSGPLPPPPLPLEVVAAIERLEGREPDSAEVVGGDCASAGGTATSPPVRPIPRLPSAPANDTGSEVHAT
jgi:hypothetical protein